MVAVPITPMGVSLCLGLITPYLSKLIIDQAYARKDLRLFIILVIAAAAVFTINSAVNMRISFLNRSIKLSIAFTLNRKVFKKLQYLPYRFFQDTSTGQHLYKIAYDIERVAQLIADIFPQAIFIIPKAFLIFGIVFYLDSKIALFSLALLPFLCISPVYFMIQLKKKIKLWVEKSQAIFERASEVLSHIQLVKAFGKEKREIKSYILALIHNTRQELANMKLELSGSFLSSISQRVILGLIIFYAGLRVMQGRLTLGGFSAITLYLAQLSGLQNILASSLQRISLGLVSCERLDSVLAITVEPRIKEGARQVVFPAGRIEFKNVTFGYLPDKMVLEDLSFCIEAGSCVGIMGNSGCGKTTAINLILGLYKPTRGEILIDGFNIDSVKPDSFYGQVAIATQEPYLWNDTIENNIRYAKEGATLKEIEEAARIACIDAFIDSLADGYQTVVGESACRISEGQKQRIAIARAVIKKPKILILDEALNSVDVELEVKIITNLRRELKDSTLIVVSHRLSTINMADAIYFFAGAGKIDIGRHQELLQRNTQYQAYLSLHS